MFNSGLNQAQALEVILTTALYARKSPAPNAGRCRIFHRRRLKTLRGLITGRDTPRFRHSADAATRWRRRRIFAPTAWRALPYRPPPPHDAAWRRWPPDGAATLASAAIAAGRAETARSPCRRKSLQQLEDRGSLPRVQRQPGVAEVLIEIAAEITRRLGRHSGKAATASSGNGVSPTSFGKCCG